VNVQSPVTVFYRIQVKPIRICTFTAKSCSKLYMQLRTDLRQQLKLNIREHREAVTGSSTPAVHKQLVFLCLMHR